MGFSESAESADSYGGTGENRVTGHQDKPSQAPFTEAFRLLYGYVRSPATRDLEAKTKVSATTIEGWLKEGRTPRREEDVVAVVDTLLLVAGKGRRGNLPPEMRSPQYYLVRLRQQKALKASPRPRTAKADGGESAAAASPSAAADDLVPPAAAEPSPSPERLRRRRPRSLALMTVLGLLVVGGTVAVYQLSQAGDTGGETPSTKDSATAKSASVPLVSVSDAASWECGDAVVVPRAVGTAGLAPGPRPADGVSASGTGFGFTVQGAEGQTVTLLGLTVEIASKKEPLRGTRVPVVCQGDPPHRNFAVDLDERSPRVVGVKASEGNGGSPSDTGWPYTVSGSDPEHFVVRPTTLTHDVTFTLLLQWAWNGKRGRLRIDDQGRPFRTTADRGAVPLCLNSTTTRLLPSPDGKPCAS
ncbi:hypothetical protein AB9128_05960 [Streptomyces cinereoruber]|uniref:hypothetical protein n=1 Tax=Streptomyces cinereoruber TaxID=67260 RepID=UPI003EBA599D